MSQNMEAIQLSSYTAPRIIEIQEKDYVHYGEDNNYFQTIIDYYNNSTTNGSIINGISSLIYGRGIQAKDANTNVAQWAKFKAMLKGRDLKNIILDRKMLGMAAIQVSYKNGQPYRMTHFPIHTLRAAKASSNGKIESWGYHSSWEDGVKDEDVERIPAFGFGNGKQNEIYVVQPYVTGSFYYTQPDYAFALPYAKLESEIGDYLINDTMNGFSGSMMVNLNGGIPKTKQERRLVKNKVINNLTGATGQKLLVNFNKSSENATTFERFTLDNAPDHYQYLADECRNKLIVGHRITSPLLVGVRETGSGFGSNADEIETSFKLMNNVLIKIYQDEIISCLDDILAESGIALDLFFKSAQPLDFYDETIASTEEEEAEEVVADELSKEEEITELSYNDYPEAAKNNAKRALKYAEENGWGSCGEATGKNRANQLAKGENITRDTIARMASFKRHQQHKDVPYTEGCGGLMWDAWGGSAGVNWAISKLKQIDKEKLSEGIEATAWAKLKSILTKKLKR
jgi:hypothetical protein